MDRLRRYPVPPKASLAMDEFLSDYTGPKGWPLVGCLPEMMKNREKTGDDLLWHKYYLQYGPIYKLKGICKEQHL